MFIDVWINPCDPWNLLLAKRTSIVKYALTFTYGSSSSENLLTFGASSAHSSIGINYRAPLKKLSNLLAVYYPKASILVDVLD